MPRSEQILRYRPQHSSDRAEWQGEILGTTPLGDGHGDDLTCTFSFRFPVTEGQDRYVVSVSHCGDFIYTFNQLASLKSAIGTVFS